MAAVDAQDQGDRQGWLPTEATVAHVLHKRLLDKLQASPRLFTEETTAPVLDPEAPRQTPASSSPI